MVEARWSQYTSGRIGNDSSILMQIEDSDTDTDSEVVLVVDVISIELPIRRRVVWSERGEQNHCAQSFHLPIGESSPSLQHTTWQIHIFKIFKIHFAMRVISINKLV